MHYLQHELPCLSFSSSCVAVDEVISKIHLIYERETQKLKFLEIKRNLHTGTLTAFFLCVMNYLRFHKIILKHFFLQCGFEVRFDGSLTRVFFSPWYHNRIRGICGNNDAEQWTDFATRRKTCMPETMTREFLREWVVPGTTCKDPCKHKHS